MTISALAIDKKMGHIKHSGLHQDICIFRKNEASVELVESKGIWLGLEMNSIGTFENQEIHLDQGDVMLLFTDGITEAVGSQGEYFGQEKLVEILQEKGHMTSEKIQEAVIRELENFTAQDDVSLLIIKKS